MKPIGNHFEDLRARALSLRVPQFSETHRFLLLSILIGISAGLLVG